MSRERIARHKAESQAEKIMSYRWHGKSVAVIADIIQERDELIVKLNELKEKLL